jgi:L-seryl-tRNA(Ser) seleniumtransferase
VGAFSRIPEVLRSLGADPADVCAAAGFDVTLFEDPAGEGRFLARIEQAFRSLPTPVIGRISEGAFRLDLRCLEDEAEFVAQLARLEA